MKTFIKIILTVLLYVANLLIAWGLKLLLVAFLYWIISAVTNITFLWSYAALIALGFLALEIILNAIIFRKNPFRKYDYIKLNYDCYYL